MSELNSLSDFLPLVIETNQKSDMTFDPGLCSFAQMRYFVSLIHNMYVSGADIY